MSRAVYIQTRFGAVLLSLFDERSLLGIDLAYAFALYVGVIPILGVSGKLAVEARVGRRRHIGVNHFFALRGSFCRNYHITIFIYFGHVLAIQSLTVVVVAVI